MIIMTLQKVPASLRGELSRWLIEVKTGVYVGHVSAMVRDRLWEKCSANRQAGCVFQAWSTNNEQHFAMRLAGENGRRVVDWEGLLLVEESKEVLSEVQKKRTRRG